MPSSRENAAAFGLVILAGSCAPLGACVVLFLHKMRHKLVLAASLSLAAGVMVLVSLCEILSQSFHDLLANGFTAVKAQATVYGAFFGGILLCYLLDIVTHCSLKWVAQSHCWLRNNTHDTAAARTNSHNCFSSKQPCVLPALELCVESSSHQEGLTSSSSAIAVKVCKEISDSNSSTDAILDVSSSDVVLGKDGELVAAGDHTLAAAVVELTGEDRGQLVKTSILIGLALTFHNLPEGLATYIGYMSSPKLGLSIALAVTLHNIPEGFAVGIPIYYATGSKLKAIGWAAVSGLAEPVGALLGLAVQSSGHLSPVAMGVVMAVVAGIMIGVSLRELIPQALSYDPDNKCVTNAVFAGMFIMGLSVVLLALWNPAPL